MLEFALDPSNLSLQHPLAFHSEAPPTIQQQRDRSVVDRVDFHHFPKNSGLDCDSALAAFCGKSS